MTPQSTQRVNYDLIADLYDEPLRDHQADLYLSKFLYDLPQNGAPVLRILDMGCGTGKQLASNKRKYPSITLVGVDKYRAMLKKAKKRCSSVSLVQADNSSMPFSDSTFDYITDQFSYSHVLDKNRLFPDIYRILKSGGRYAMTHIDPWSMPNWLIYKYFPESRQCDFNDFLTADNFMDRMMQAGFVNTKVTREFKNEMISLSELLDYASQRHRTSQLMIISDQSYENGLATIREQKKKFGDSYKMESELCLITITSEKICL